MSQTLQQYLLVLGNHSQSEGPHDELREHLLSHECDDHGPVLTHSTGWPVLVTLHHTILNWVGYHDNVVDILFPYHAPEVDGSVWQRTLGCYVLILMVVPLWE